MYFKWSLALIITLGLGFSLAASAHDDLPSLSKMKIAIEHEQVITMHHMSLSMLMALDNYFNQNTLPELNNHLYIDSETIPPDVDNAFDDYIEAQFLAETSGKDNLNEKISQNTLADYRKLTSKAKAYISRARDISTIVRGLSGNDLVELPIALRFSPFQDKPDFGVTLVIVDIKLYPRYTHLHTYLMIESAELAEEPLIFYAPNIKFSMKSGIIGDNVLGLMGDYPLPVLSEKAILKLKQGNINTYENQGVGTFAVLGCDGLKNLSIGAEVIFSRDWIKPATSRDNENQRVTAHLQLEELQDLSSIYADLTIEPFVLTGMEDFIWSASNIAIDMSEQISPPGIMGRSEMVYFGLPDRNGNPIEYKHRFSNPGALWKGFYIGTVGVGIPDKLNPDQLNLAIFAEHLIFDDVGISGQATAAAQPLLQFGDSSFDGWAFGIDEMTLTVVESQHMFASFAGNIHVPLLGNQEEDVKSAALYYEALIDPENGYQFLAGFNESKTIPMMVADAEIHPSSYFQVIFNNDVNITALINADIHIQKSLSESLELDLPKVGIRNVAVRNFGDKLELNTSRWEIDVTEKMDFGLFSLELDPANNEPIESNYTLIKSMPSTAIDFIAKATLSAAENLTGTGSFSITGRLEEVNGLERWVHDNLVINAFCVKGEGIIAGIEQMEGCLEFYSSQRAGVWGDGFRGFMDIKPSKIFEELKMITQFGQSFSNGSEGFQYYMIDATADLKKGIPIGGSIYLNGFGGGYYKNLIRPDAALAFDQILLPDYADLFIQNYGASMSGVKYELPTDDVESYGFKGTAILSTDATLEEEKNVAFSANLEMGMQYAKTLGETGWGIQNIYFQGVGEFMSGFDPGRAIRKYSDFTPGMDVEKLTELQTYALSENEKRARPQSMPIDDSMISAKVLLQASFDCPAFHGILGVYLNAGMIYGQSQAELYIGRNCSSAIDGPGTEWHLFIGRSTEPTQLGIDLPLIGNLARMWAYFMIGNHGMPDKVPDPTDYVELFGTGYDPSVSSEARYYEGISYFDDRIGNASGFATGMGIKIATPPEGLKFLFLSADLRGGMGLDFLVRRFVQSECSSSVGINGWYGKGQGYLYAFAGVNIHLNLWFATIKKQILSAGVGALMKVEGPNPFFARGRLDASLNALGIIDVKVKFKVNLGTTLAEYLSEECGDEFNTAENPIVDEVYPSIAPGEDGTYPGYTDFIVDMNFEPLVTNKEGNIDYVFDLVDQNTYADIIDILIKKESKSTLVKAGMITIEDSEGTNIDYTLEYLNKSYPNSRKEKFKVRIKPKSLLSPGEYTVRVPALVKAKNIPDYGPFKEYQVGDWFYGEGQIGDPYRFIINDSLFQPKITDREILLSYPTKGMENFYPDELSGQALTEEGYPDLSFRPGIMIASNSDLTYMINPSKVPVGYTPAGLITEKISGKRIGKPMDFTLLTFDTDKQVILFEKNNALKASMDYVFKFVYLADEQTKINEQYGEAWEIYSLPFRTSAFAKFDQKVKQFSGPIIGNNENSASKKAGNMQWYYTTEEGFSQEEMNIESGARIEVQFDNLNRKQEYWLADNDLFWNLFEEYNDCESDIFAGYIHPAEDLKISSTEDKITLASNVHITMANILRKAKEYVLSHDLCTESEGGNSDLPGPGGGTGSDEQVGDHCSNFYVEGVGLQSNNGLVYKPGFTQEICNNFSSVIPTIGEFTYGVRFNYRIPILTQKGLSSLTSSNVVLPLIYKME